ncbi:MAG: TIGR04190 family B12-binding domain/radical SAM domain protein [archaeon]|nr:TIGR04190 family B12-binding domain/radical SAM domain protein [archaeon]MCP8313478.1 TIGR04190 family B12-binding domain/radical SAM domain protein [archaeon]
MPKPDLVLLHPPSVYDFRKESIMYGPISDVIPPTPIFDMYPIGFVSILGYLERHGYNVRIVNLAIKMLEDQKFDPEALIKSLNPKAFGIDFHWLVHAQGSLELAKIIKRHHPNIPVILGGLSSTYFHTQIIENYPQVDYVIRGDSTEQPLLQLMQYVEENRYPEDVPNVTWRDANKKIHVNPLTFVPESLDDFVIDAGRMVRASLRYGDISGHLPYHEWDDYPITSVLACKGCIFNCVTCGGSNYAYRKICNRFSLACIKPEKLVEGMKIIQQYTNGPIFIIGDLRMAGKDYAESVLSIIRKEGLDNPVILELFTPASEDYLEKIAESVPNFSLEISPESHDETIRYAFGRPYKNNELEKTISKALKLGCQRFDIFFMIGLPYQTKESALNTVEYCQSLLKEHGGDRRLHPFIAPLAPFLDLGSIAFENPENHGYQLFFKELENYRQAMYCSSWKYFLNYQTFWMSRDELVEVTYEAACLLNSVKVQHNLIDSHTAEKMNIQIQSARSTLQRIDEIMKIDDTELRTQRLEHLRSQIEEANQRLLCSKDELLKWPLH